MNTTPESKISGVRKLNDFDFVTLISNRDKYFLTETHINNFFKKELLYQLSESRMHEFCSLLLAFDFCFSSDDTIKKNIQNPVFLRGFFDFQIFSFVCIYSPDKTDELIQFKCLWFFSQLHPTNIKNKGQFEVQLLRHSKYAHVYALFALEKNKFVFDAFLKFCAQVFLRFQETSSLFHVFVLAECALFAGLLSPTSFFEIIPPSLSHTSDGINDFLYKKIREYHDVKLNILSEQDDAFVAQLPTLFEIPFFCSKAFKEHDALLLKFCDLEKTIKKYPEHFSV